MVKLCVLPESRVQFSEKAQKGVLLAGKHCGTLPVTEIELTKVQGIQSIFALLRAK